MEGSFQGDLADVVRASGGGIGDVARVSDYAVDPLSVSEGGFGDPFSSMRDPLLVELEGIGHGFHGADQFSIGDERSSAFQISCTSDHNNTSISCEGLMNRSSPKGNLSSSFGDTTRAQISCPRNPVLKRRKSQAKKVVCIPAPSAVNSRQGGGEVVPSDLWAWRKYGQKPIKGSPYPRGYYRCSSSKGCSARKQVERSRTDPNMLVITYTSEHNHPWPTQRNSLAGSSRIPVSSSTATSSNPPPPPSLTTTVKAEPDPQTEPLSNVTESSKPPDHHDVTLPSHQLMMDELVFESYRPVMQEEVPNAHDFFADLQELEEPDPLSLLGGNKSMLDDVDDPFGSLFDWSASSNTNTTAATNHENSH